MRGYKAFCWSRSVPENSEGGIAECSLSVVARGPHISRYFHPGSVLAAAPHFTRHGSEQPWTLSCAGNYHFWSCQCLYCTSEHWGNLQNNARSGLQLPAMSSCVCFYNLYFFREKAKNSNQCHTLSKNMRVKVWRKRLKLLNLQAVVFAQRHSDYILNHGLFFGEFSFSFFFLFS